MATIYEQDFNALNTADLNGQDSWSGDASFDVQEAVKQEGAKGLECASTSIVTIARVGTQLAEGSVSVYMRRNATDDGASRFYILEDTTEVAGVMLYSDGKIYYMGSSNVELGSYVADTWYKLDIQWRTSPSKQVRFRLDDGNWTDWVNPINSWTTGPNKVQPYVRDQTTAISYWDLITEADTGQTIDVSETFSIGEDSKQNLTLNITDTFSLSDTVSAGKVIIISILDTLGVSDFFRRYYNKRTKPSRGTYTKRTKPSRGTYTKRPKV